MAEAPLDLFGSTQEPVPSYQDSDEVLRLKKYVRVLSLINPQMKQKEMGWDRDKAILQ